MTIELSIRGAEGLRRFGQEIRRLGNGSTIPKEMSREIRAAVKPIRKAVKAHEVAVLPTRGGLGAWVAKGRISASIRRGARTAGITISQGRNSQRKRTDMKALDAGQIRHPLFGNRDAWYTQAVVPRAFTDPASEGATEFREAVVVAVDKAVIQVLG